MHNCVGECTCSSQPRVRAKARESFAGEILFCEYNYSIRGYTDFTGDCCSLMSDVVQQQMNKERQLLQEWKLS